MSPEGLEETTFRGTAMNTITQFHQFKRSFATERRVWMWISAFLVLCAATSIVPVHEASAQQVSPSSLSFSATQGGANPANQTLSISNHKKRGVTKNWNATDSASWLTISPASGTISTETDQVIVSANISGLAAGTYQASILVTLAGDKDGTSQTSVPVTLTVNATSTSSPSSITLQWTPNQESDLAGYKVYIGTASGTYGAPLSIGKVSSYMINGLPTGSTYFMAITAFDTSGNESGYSNEISTSIY